MNIVFLDFDGVLNGQHMADQIDMQHRQNGCSNKFATRADGTAPRCHCFELQNQLDKSCIARLNVLLARTSAKVVLSTSWRRILDTEDLARILRDNGFAGEIVGATPDLANDPTWGDWHRENAMVGASCDRGWEIEDWLHAHPEVSSFVILDDCSDMARLKACHVLTDDRIGLQDVDVTSAEHTMAKYGQRYAQSIREEPWR